LIEILTIALRIFIQVYVGIPILKTITKKDAHTPYMLINPRKTHNMPVYAFCPGETIRAAKTF
jgi:hypothetical protein